MVILIVCVFLTYLDVKLRECHQKAVPDSDDQTTSIETTDRVGSHHNDICNIDQENRKVQGCLPANVGCDRSYTHSISFMSYDLWVWIIPAEHDPTKAPNVMSEEISC